MALFTLHHCICASSSYFYRQTAAAGSIHKNWHQVTSHMWPPSSFWGPHFQEVGPPMSFLANKGKIYDFFVVPSGKTGNCSAGPPACYRGDRKVIKINFYWPGVFCFPGERRRLRFRISCEWPGQTTSIAGAEMPKIDGGDAVYFLMWVSGHNLSWACSSKGNRFGIIWVYFDWKHTRL